MDFKFDSEQELLRQAAREFAETRVAPLVPEMEKTGKWPAQLGRALGEAGFLGVLIPEEYGGTALGHLARMIILEEIGTVSVAVAMALQVFVLGIQPIVDAGTQEQKERFLPALATGERLATVAVTEASGGSDPAHPSTVYRPETRDGVEGFVVNGRKVFITNAHVADVQVILAKSEGDDPKLSAFIVEAGTGGFRPGREEHKIGFRGCNTGEIVLEDCFVPRENLLGAEGDGLKVALKSISEVGRAGMAGCSLGLLNACLRAAASYAAKRELYGKPINRLPAIQSKLADISLGLETSRLLAYKAAWLKDTGARCDTEMAMAKYHSTESAILAAKLAAEVHGGYGYMEEYPTERYLRDAQLLIPSAGTSDVMKILIGRAAGK